ncbi:TPA: hypothetical protein ACJIW3_004498 [Enterobacter hormaechei]
MLDKFLALLERFVVAHELIAANSGNKKTSVGELTVDVTTTGVETVKKELDKALKEVEKAKAKPEEDDLADDETEEKPKARKTRATKPKAEPEPDLDKLREEIEVMAKHIGSGDSDDCADELDDLLDEYDARSVKKLKDLQVQEFHKELKAIVAKYYDIED